MALDMFFVVNAQKFFKVMQMFFKNGGGELWMHFEYFSKKRSFSTRSEFNCLSSIMNMTCDIPKLSMLHSASPYFKIMDVPDDATHET